jgi:hypothetical protein
MSHNHRKVRPVLLGCVLGALLLIAGPAGAGCPSFQPQAHTGSTTARQGVGTTHPAGETVIRIAWDRVGITA